MLYEVITLLFLLALSFFLAVRGLERFARYPFFSTVRSTMATGNSVRIDSDGWITSKPPLPNSLAINSASLSKVTSIV